MSRRLDSWHVHSMETPSNVGLARGLLSRCGLLLVLVAAALSLSAGACESHGHGEDEGQPSGATCPATQTLTYANFGMAFFAQYCQRCHASAVTGAARNGAPEDHVFDTVTDIMAMREHIDREAAAGPTVVNESMPPSGAAPPDAERRKLGEWLACGAPP